MRIMFKVAGLSGLSDSNTIKSFYRQVFAKAFPGSISIGSKSNGSKLLLIC